MGKQIRCTLGFAFLSCLLLAEHETHAGQWELHETKQKRGLYSVYFIDQKQGWAVTFGDTILFTNDGGKTWTENFKVDETKKRQLRFFNVKHAELNDVYFVNKDEGWVVGAGNESLILHAPDGGVTWQYQESGLKPFVVSNWIGQSVEIPKELQSVYFVTPQEGWAVGGFGSIIHTSDGGYTWKRQNKWVGENYWDVFFIDQWNGWIVGDRGTILHTSNGGEGWFWPWKKQDSGTYMHLSGVQFVDKETGWVVGGNTVLHTTDSGKTWKEQARFDETDSLRSVYFVDRNTGWVVGHGPVQHTQDGGRTWIAQPTNTPYYLISVQCVGRDNCWAVGEHGTVLHYVNNGRP